jgi:hypothetical protein
LTTPAEIEIEKTLFKKELCKENTDACKADIDRFWPDIAKAIFEYSETPKDICAVSIDICSKSADQCAECSAFLVNLINKLYALKLIDLLKKAEF